MISIFVSRADDSVRRIHPSELDAAIAAARRNEQVIWVDLEAPTAEEETEILARAFKFHHLAVSDVRHEHLKGNMGDHLPKVEDYGEYVFSIINPIGGAVIR